MQPVTDAPSAGHVAASAETDASVKTITGSMSTVRIDPGQSGPAAEIAGGSTPPQTQTSPVRIEAKGSSAAARPLSHADRIRHDALVSGSQSTCLQLAKLPMTLREIDARVLNVHVGLLEGDLDAKRIDDAVDLFGALGKELCAPQFQKQGLGLWQRVLGEMGDESSLRAGVAWLHAARLYDAAGQPETALHAYGHALAILEQPQWQLDSPDDAKNLKEARRRQDELVPFDRIRLDVGQMLERQDVQGADKQLVKTLTRPLTPREQIQCLQMAGDIKVAQGVFQMAVHYYQASANRANERPDEFKAEADEAVAKREGLESKLDPAIVRQIAAACRGSQPTLDQLLLNAARQLNRDDHDLAARMLDGLIPRLMKRDPPSALIALSARRNVSIDLKDGQTTRLSLDLVQVYLGLGKSAEAAVYLLGVLSDANTTQWLSRGLLLARALFQSRGMGDVAQWCQAASLRALTPQDAATLDKHLTDLSLTAAQELREREQGMAAHALDLIIPRLSRRGDMKSALSALLDRRSISADLGDGHTTRLDLDLAHTYVRCNESANAAYCLLNALTDEKAMDWLSRSLKVAAPLFERHGIPGAVQWCQATSKRQLKNEDLQTIEGYLGHVLTRVVDDAARQAAAGQFDPLLKYAKDLVCNGISHVVPDVFNLVLSKHKEVDVDSLEQALSGHMKEIASPDEFNAISVQLRLAIADFDLREEDLPSAAWNLKRALDAELDEASLGACLACAGRIAAAAGEARSAVYFTEAARLCNTSSESAEGSSGDPQAQRGAAQLETKLTPEEVEAIRQEAGQVDPGSTQMMDAVHEMIEKVRLPQLVRINEEE